MRTAWIAVVAIAAASVVGCSKQPQSTTEVEAPQQKVKVQQDGDAVNVKTQKTPATR